MATTVIVEHCLQKGDLLNHQIPVSALANLRAMAAPPQSRVEAMNLLGQVYELQKQEEKALQLYRQAALRPSPLPGPGGQPISSKGPEYAHVRIGLILLRGSDRSGAEAQFRKAALEFDDPLGHYHLARLDKSSSEMKETYLLKAASSGILNAAADLGQLHIARAKSAPADKKEEKATEYKLAKEWLYLAATSEDGRGMLSLAQAFKEEGNLKSGLKWLEAAEKHKDARVAQEAAKMRATF
jgi:hypothetical protein